MRYSIPVIAACSLVLCQCASVPDPVEERTPLTQSGLSPLERQEAARDRPLSRDPNDPMSNVHARDGAVGLRVLDF